VPRRKFSGWLVVVGLALWVALLGGVAWLVLRDRCGPGPCGVHDPAQSFFGAVAIRERGPSTPEEMVMWDCLTEIIESSRVEHYVPQLDGAPLSYRDILQRWQHDTTFRAFFLSLLASSPFSTYRWETPAITLATTNRRFEFVLIDSPELTCEANRSAFNEHFARRGDEVDVLTVPNLSGDAWLIIPTPIAEDAVYPDLATFIRRAPERQQHNMWQTVGRCVEAQLSSEPVWLSTAGAGVAWLHVRLDRRPKYYCYAPYRFSS
jgi:hypothetical protein